jgi:hypothetical protein
LADLLRSFILALPVTETKVALYILSHYPNAQIPLRRRCRRVHVCLKSPSYPSIKSKRQQQQQIGITAQKFVAVGISHCAKDKHKKRQQMRLRRRCCCCVSIGFLIHPPRPSLSEREAEKVSIWERKFTNCSAFGPFFALKSSFSSFCKHDSEMGEGIIKC